MPTSISSVSELNSHLSRAKDKLTVIKFEADWCGPCHTIAPVFQSLSEEYKSVNFFKVDVERAKDVAQLYRVTSMPTFIFLRGSEKVDQVRGANKSALEIAMRRHSSGSSSAGGAFTGKGHSLGGSSTSSGPSLSSVAEKLNSALPPMNPQLKALMLLTGGYLLLWWLQ